MKKLVKDGDITEDYWTVVEAGVEELDSNLLKKGNVLLPLDNWLNSKASLTGVAKLGIWLTGDIGFDTIPEDVLALPVIAIHFPAFVDGRGFSLARQLREHRDYGGDIRALGHFAADQMFYLKRCGFSSFVVDQESDDAISACLNAFSNSYQAAIDEPRPLFRRRAQ